MSWETVTFIGGGNMASAMIGGLEQLEEAPRIVVCDPSEAARARHQALGRETQAHIRELQGARLVILAFKPQHFSSAVEDLRHALSDDALIVSIMVGVSCATIEAALPTVRVVRVMPNTPMAVGKGMSGVAPGSRAQPHDVDVAARICEASGAVLRVDESRIDAVAAVSGSGPAYFYRFCELLVSAATQVCGFSQDEAELLVAQTARGAIHYLDAQAGFPAGRLREEVTSPGGTTQAALEVFKQRALPDTIAHALSAALTRAEELNKAAEASSR